MRGRDVEIRGIAFDSRKTLPDYLFVCIKGLERDGHDFAGAALKAGAAGLIVEDFLEYGSTQVKVPDSRLALARVAREYMDRPDEKMGLVGVTGTNGKTTTAKLITWIFRRAGRVSGDVTTAGITIGEEHQPNPVHQTTPSSLELQELLASMHAKGVEWAVLETTSHGLDQQRVAGFAFKRAVFTRITHEHLEYHRTVEAYVEAKARLLDLVAGAPAGRWGKAAILNADDPHLAVLRNRANVPVVTYGRSAGSDVRVLEETATATGLEIRAASPWGVLTARSTLPGAFNVENCLAAAACAASTGVDITACADAIQTFAGVKGRMERIEGGQPFAVIVDYAHTPDGLVSVLNTLKQDRGNLLLAFGSAGERDIAKRPMMGAIAARLADYFIITDEDPRGEDRMKIAAEIAAGARQERPSADFEIVLDRREAIGKLLAMARSGDTVVLAGKGHEASIIGADGEIPWDEAHVAREIMSEMGFSG